MRRQAKAIAATATATTRRQAVVWAGGALLAVAGVALLGRRAHAITLMEADEKTQALYHAACGPVAYHERVVAEARAALAGRGPTAPQVAQDTVACPVCGCRLALDDGRSGRSR
ncbi:MAG: hypothetical protein KIT36_11065 [Alphaproteobacteria bacterium]|nr:hypothetical protein [Alphaproteobacteria bacterium]